MRVLQLTCMSFVLIVAAAGCDKPASGDDRGKTSPMPDTPAATQTAAAPTAPAAEPSAAEPPKPARQHVELQIASVGNTMTFDKTSLSVPAGAEVHLVFKNNATMTVLPHNWMLVKPGTEASVAAAGLKLGEMAGYFDVNDKDILAHTPLTKPGESSEVTFIAPEQPGKYPYICTVPGHYMMMKGTLTVTP
jgi:azurin